MHILDTCILIDYLRGLPAAAASVDNLPDSRISIISWMEVMVGAKSEQESALLRQFLQSFPVLELDKAVSEEAVSLRQQHRIKLPDAVVWATARVHQAQLVTVNTKDFTAHHADVVIPYIPSTR